MQAFLILAFKKLIEFIQSGKWKQYAGNVFERNTDYNTAGETDPVAKKASSAVAQDSRVIFQPSVKTVIPTTEEPKLSPTGLIRNGLEKDQLDYLEWSFRTEMYQRGGLKDSLAEVQQRSDEIVSEKLRNAMQKFSKSDLASLAGYLCTTTGRKGCISSYEMIAPGAVKGLQKRFPDYYIAALNYGDINTDSDDTYYDNGAHKLNPFCYTRNSSNLIKPYMTVNPWSIGRNGHKGVVSAYNTDDDMITALRNLKPKVVYIRMGRGKTDTHSMMAVRDMSGNYIMFCSYYPEVNRKPIEWLFGRGRPGWAFWFDGYQRF